MQDLVNSRFAPGRRLAGWRLAPVAAGVVVSLAFPLGAAAHPTPEEVGAEVVACAAGGVDLSDCVDNVKLAIFVEVGLAELPLPSSGNPPIPPVPPVPQT